MAKMYVVTRVAGKAYLIKTEAESMGGAESKILENAVCGAMNEYSIEAAQAFDEKSMKTDTFIWMALEAEPISMEDFKEIVEKRNEELIERKKAEEKLFADQRALDDLKARVEQLEREIKDGKRYLGYR